MACSSPWARIESANSAKAPSSMRVRGWYLPGCSLSIASEDGAVAGSASVSAASEEPPSSASRPRPRPLMFLVAMSNRHFVDECIRIGLPALDPLDHFGTERDIGLRTLGRGIETHSRHAVGRCFGQAYVARNDGLEYLVAKVLFELGRYLLRKCHPWIKHHAQQ